VTLLNRYANIPRPGGGVDERWLIISFASVTDVNDAYGGAVSYTVMFPSSTLREQFVALCKEHGCV